MEKQLTISVAAYNVENYLDQLMKSIIDADSMELLEVLIVNDGSKDSTAEKAQKYQQLYPDSVRLIDKENGGHGSTINRGIQEAKGKYFRALDGDDWVNPENLKMLVQQLEDIDVDIVLSDYCECYENGKTKVCNDFPELEDAHSYTFDEIAEKVDWMRYHTVIYRTEILQKNSIRLDEHCFYVDTEFMLFPIPFIKTVYYFKPFIYCYRLGIEGQSMSPESRKKNLKNAYTVSESILNYYIQHSQELSESKKRYFIKGIANHCNFIIRTLMMFPASKEKKQELIAYDQHIKETVPECYEEMLNKGKLSRLIKGLRIARYHSYGLICWYKTHKIKR